MSWYAVEIDIQKEVIEETPADASAAEEFNRISGRNVRSKFYAALDTHCSFDWNKKKKQEKIAEEN